MKITNFTNKGECSRCGQCCGDILHLSHEEINRIDEYIKEHDIKPTQRLKICSYDNTCPFRDSANMICKIYEVRPDICRVFKCDKSPEECVKNRELNNQGKLPRSMRNLFFKDDEGARWVAQFGINVYNRKDKVVK